MPRTFAETREAWPTLGFYERFEQIICLVLTVLISFVIVVSTWHLSLTVLKLLLSDAIDPANQATFQAIFGMIMTVLIALEFKHSLVSVLERRASVVQVRTVILIALLAMVRKFIIIDAATVAPVTLIGLALAVLALGSVYWLMREPDRSGKVTAKPRHG